MRSRPYTPPPALPSFLDDIAAMLPIPKPAYRSKDDSDIQLQELDPESSRLIPQKKKSHRVWVQGKLAQVRSVSTSRIKSQKKAREGGKGKDVDKNTEASQRRNSVGGEQDAGTETEDEETAVRARQLRGYGIGGIGNIRRPTEVIHGPNPPPAHGEASTLSKGRTGSKWNLREMLALEPEASTTPRK
ncbi:uncharacterized protein F5Z01DRAFT_662920 [Emericellopsis atlantica]|uniref:Uncharacterized protein n=1 Tax=Emericellopsis atlantica TaxID=2614577 RepID=A0A9P8CM71_9HYPO|nr:uncharacterized protein F5Z01DRAFT_662920 [Emericellopsis atlantica]KAG9251787.1 hypothetical protein F5Z01DRAFT_662920 [Emericellopsis atlantica]